MNSNEVHSVFSPKPNLTIVLQIPMATFENYYSEERFVLFSHEPGVDDSQMMELIQNMYENYVKRACGYEFQVQSQFYMLMYLMITQYRINEVSEDMVKNHRKLNRLSSITSYIRDNYQKELSLEYIAEIFGYSRRIYQKCFRSMQRSIIKRIYKVCV